MIHIIETFQMSIIMLRMIYMYIHIAFFNVSYMFSVILCVSEMREHQNIVGILLLRGLSPGNAGPSFRTEFGSYQSLCFSFECSLRRADLAGRRELTPQMSPASIGFMLYAIWSGNPLVIELHKNLNFTKP